ncbi:putative membrane protein [Halobacteroides halobius DSM 5150]|uniref:UPF0756 membrane protein Halha_1505 n=1 Tax=Halobacteroides halobius (strain ATCC 35273 / DSM 5150 / MD-1) TaxID=748449 RepID=L0K8V7_HALHC|nr:DUF441 domain-containing protein [Halobacteroides halobius]AGB41446.1 putative membrane protein [Halobacteroides halobius DSM 5150]
MLESYLLLTFVLALGLLAGSNLLVIASTILGLLKLFKLNFILNILDGRGIKLGLLFLLMAVLSPMASDKLGIKDIIDSYKSVLGLFALVSGILATQVVGVGINLLDSDPELVVGILLGSIVGIVFFNGVPVGPLLAGGLTAIFYRIYSLLLG